MVVDNGFISKQVNTFRQGDIITRLIYLNVVVFLITALAEVVLTLFNVPQGAWKTFLMFPASLELFIKQPWTLISYMFMHAGVFHILFNMLWLFWFGKLALNFFSSKHIRGLYLLGGIMGAVVYMLAYHLFPYFQNQIEYAHVVGASASVLAIVVASAVREPEFPVRFMFIGTVRLKYVALFMVALDLLFMVSDNAGGHIAHLGGALAGWWFAAGLTKGHDATKWINAVIDCCSLNRKKKSSKPKMNVYYGSGRRQEGGQTSYSKETEDEINRILEKLRKSGYDHLTTEEKKSLFDASRK